MHTSTSGIIWSIWIICWRWILLGGWTRNTIGLLVRWTCNISLFLVRHKINATPNWRGEIPWKKSRWCSCSCASCCDWLWLVMVVIGYGCDWLGYPSTHQIIHPYPSIHPSFHPSIPNHPSSIHPYTQKKHFWDKKNDRTTTKKKIFFYCV